MPKQAGTKLSTPLIREYRRWLTQDVGRASRTVEGYVDQVEFFAATMPSAALCAQSMMPPPVCAPYELRYVTDQEPVWGEVILGELEAFVRAPLFSAGSLPSQSTRRKRAYALKAFFEFLCDHDTIEVDPAAKLRGPGVQVGKPKPIPDDVWLAIWDQDMGMDDRVMLGLGYYLGLRRHEMIGLAPSNVDLERRRMSAFQRKGGKVNEVVYGSNLDIITARLPHLSVRLGEFEADLATLTRSRACTGRMLALTEHVGVNEPNSAINRRLTALSSRTRTHVTPHQMRHSFGTNLLRAGVPAIVVADQMAHSSLETTRGYLDTTQWYDTMQLERAFDD